MRVLHRWALGWALMLVSGLNAVAQSDEALRTDAAGDDTAALQQMIDASRDGLHLTLPNRTLRITRPLVIALEKTGPVTITGESATRLVMAGPGPAIQIVGTHQGTADPASVLPNVWSHQRTPGIRGFEIVGEHPEADGIEARGTMQLTLDRMTIRQTRHAVHLVDRNRNLAIANCHLYQNHGVGIFYDDVNLHQSNITGCHISYNRAGGIVIRGGDVRNVHITGCDIEANMGTTPEEPPAANVWLEGAAGSFGEIAITGCTLQHSPKGTDSANIYIDGHSQELKYTDERRHGNVTITGNILSDVQHNLRIRRVRGVTILGNVIWQGYQHNLWMEDCDAIVFSQNVMDRNPRYNYGDAAAAQLRIRLEQCTHAVMDGNIIRGAAPEVEAIVSLNHCQHLVLSGWSASGFSRYALSMDQVADVIVRGWSVDRSDSAADAWQVTTDGERVQIDP